MDHVTANTLFKQLVRVEGQLGEINGKLDAVVATNAKQHERLNKHSERMDGIDGRITGLHVWKNRVQAAAAVIIAIIGAAWAVVKDVVPHG